MGKKFTQFTEDLSPDDGYIILGVDPVSGLSKRSTRGNFLSGEPITDPTILGSTDGDLFKGKFNGWVDANQTVSVQTNSGLKQHILKIAGVDATSQFSAGMRGYIDRSISPPTQCTDLESTTLQQFWTRASASVSGISFTDDYTLEGWAKPESYTGSGQSIVSRRTAVTSGFDLRVSGNGEIELLGLSGGNYRVFSTYEALPLDRWSHVAGVMDMSAATGLVYVNGYSKTVAAQNSGSPSSITQSGDLQVGAYTGGNQYFDGKVSDVRIWSTKRTAAQIADNMNIVLTGSETNLVGYWKFNGNGNDSTTNANNLTATGTGTTPTATNADNPMNSREFFIIHDVALSGSDTLLTVFTGLNYNIPNTSLSNFHFSTDDRCYGFPDESNWYHEVIIRTDSASLGALSSGSWVNSGRTIDFGIGKWKLDTNIQAITISTVSSYRVCLAALSTSTSAPSDDRLVGFISKSNALTDSGGACYINESLTLAAITKYYVLIGEFGSNATAVYLQGSKPLKTVLRAKSAWT